MTQTVVLTKVYALGNVEVAMGRLNKPKKEGYTYRSPNQTNAKDLTPNPKEDVVASNEADLERIKKGLDQKTNREGERGYMDRAKPKRLRVGRFHELWAVQVPLKLLLWRVEVLVT